MGGGGALDGKHIAIKCPNNGGSIFYNYKGFHSLILMAMVDVDYVVDVGRNGSAEDAQVFSNSELRVCIEGDTVAFPVDYSLPDDDRPMPYFVVADDASSTRTWLMKPYSTRQPTLAERVFNFRLPRARRRVENVFGILAHYFQCLITTI